MAIVPIANHRFNATPSKFQKHPSYKQKKLCIEAQKTLKSQ
jgi:hypothetical protein